MMPMERGDFHERDGREFMAPYPFRSYDDFHVQKGKKGKRRQHEPSYNDDRGNRAHFFMGPHGPGGFYPMPPYGHDPYFYGGPGYGRDGPRQDRPDDRKGMSMYPEGRRGSEPYNKNLPPGRGYPGNYEDRQMMREQPMGQPQGMMNRRDGPNGPPREGRPGAG